MRTSPLTYLINCHNSLWHCISIENWQSQSQYLLAKVRKSSEIFQFISPPIQKPVTLAPILDGKPYDRWYSLLSENKEIAEIHLKMQYFTPEELNNFFIVTRNNFSELQRILQDNNIVILATLCKVNDSEELAKIIIRFVFFFLDLWNCLNKTNFKKYKTPQS